MAPRSDAAALQQPHPMSQAELARRCKRTRQTVGEALQGQLAAARMSDGRVNAAHDAVLRWAAERGIAADVLLAPVVIGAVRSRDDSRQAEQPETNSERDGEMERLLDLTLRQIVKQHGSAQGFYDYVDAVKSKPNASAWRTTRPRGV